MKFGTREEVKIDVAHSELIKGLILAHKPVSILEMGVGGGQSTNAILSGIEYNAQDYNYTLVDNWLDFEGKCPQEVVDLYSDKMDIVTSDEKDFVFSTKDTYDFIMSDADHYQTDQWFEHVYDNLLNPGGILIYHDVNLIDENAFKNLITIYDRCKEQGKSHMLFNKNTLPTERCHRGLLVIFKN